MSAVIGLCEAESNDVNQLVLVILHVCSKAVAYLCGHLHTLGGLMPVLHSRHSTGTLELELGDWMDNRR